LYIVEASYKARPAGGGLGVPGFCGGPGLR
jgi:hypothetical protein